MVLTKNPNVKVLELLSYTRVDLLTIREVNWNDTNFTTMLLLWEMSEGCVEVRRQEDKADKEEVSNTKLTANSLISSATFCSLS